MPAACCLLLLLLMKLSRLTCQDDVMVSVLTRPVKPTAALLELVSHDETASGENHLLKFFSVNDSMPSIHSICVRKCYGTPLK